MTVILFTFLLVAIIASVLGWSDTERRLVLRNAHWLESRNAAEAVAEYGFAQIDTQFSLHSSTPNFDPAGTGAVVYPSTSFWSGSHVDGGTYSSTDTTGIQLVAGNSVRVPTSGFYYIDPTNLANEQDPLKGQYVARQDVVVLARATVIPKELGYPVTTYVKDIMSVRGAPMFANAIFYSANDLELFPGPTMNIVGPVHVNGNMFVSSQGNSLNFSGGVVSMSGNLYHAWSNSASASEGSGGETLGTSPVTFVNALGTPINLYHTNSAYTQSSTVSIWNDSTMGSDSGVSGLSSLAALVSTTTTAGVNANNGFKSYIQQTYNGNLQTTQMGVSNYNPVSFNEQIGVDSSGNPIYANPHSIIEPPSPPATTDPYYTAKEEVEQQKFANGTYIAGSGTLGGAGLYVLVTVSAAATDTNGNPIGPPTAVISLYGPSGSTISNAASGTGPNGGPLIGTYTTSDPNGIFHFKPYAAVASGNNTTTATVPTSTPTLQTSGTNKNKYATTMTTTTTVTPTSQTTYSTGTTTAGPTGASPTTTTSNSTNYASNSSVPSSSSSSSSTMAAPTSVSSGMYDNRRNMGIDIIDIDMSALNKAVTAMSNNTATNAITYTDTSGHTQVWGSGTATPWNGGVYVDVEAPNPESSSQSASVRLINGQTTSTTASMMPSWGPNGNGFTLATNAPVYIKGNFNADGVITSSSSTTPDSGNVGANGATPNEGPTCVAGDAITILSNGFNDSTSLTSLDPAAAAGTNNGTTSPSSGVEVASALMTGLVATSNSASSGGAHNLPRFLEDFSGITVAIRGSLTCLYSSEVATQPWSTRYYSPPNRQWGFNQIFANAHFPPLTPKVWSFRRAGFTTLSASAYATALHALYPSEF